MRQYSHHNGFTLLEVMVAMAILAIALVAVFRSQAQSISIANEARLATTASFLAQSKMAEIESMGVEGTDGDFGEDFSNYRWEVSTSDTELKDLTKVKLIVTWKKGNFVRERRVIFYKYEKENE
ncbi:MAG: type II secretion system minor pseudopilin GspI [Deltaproteobacteria bacterium]|nr:type II secretion system minor pseudopilin GspI [Deltaproteobacteria bacterium]